MSYNCIISVVMPAYNCERYIAEAINSVLSQTYQCWELIIIDDGSSDKTIEIVDELSDKDDRIRFYKNEKNKGVAATRNIGISYAKSEWIAFLDSDDVWEKTKLEEQLYFAQSLGLNFLYTASSFMNEYSEMYNYIFGVPERVCFKQLLKQNVISCSSVLIKKKLMQKHSMIQADIHEDFATWLKILHDESYAFGISKPLLIYRISSSSKSGNKIKSLIMTYKTYRIVGLTSISAIYYLLWNITNGLIKYLNILIKAL